MKYRNCSNMTTIKRICAGMVMLLLVADVSAAGFPEKDPYPLFFLQRNLSKILVNDNFSPPVASRNYVYPHIAAYYILNRETPGGKLYDSIRHFPAGDMPVPTGNYSPSLAASFAFFEVAKTMVYTRQPFVDSFLVLLNWYKIKGIDEITFRNSENAGKQVALKIIDWMNQDRFIETRKMSKYVLLKSPGKWQITSPGYFPAVEPHWGEIRPMILQKPYGFENILPVPFDTSVNSRFYKEAMTVYSTGNNLTVDQKLVASFWDCNPFAVHPTGHINTIIKKISPGGHWMNIAGIACAEEKYDIGKTSKVFTLCALAVFDAFIYTWDLKYEYSYLRPETFIEQTGIDGNWQPYIQSPPFPEFPSGHAVISNAAAGVLTALFGKDFGFTDNTETEFGLPERHFSSFQVAADEATISRLYGGIHFLFSCNTGKEMGKMLASDILARLHR